jgi:sugar phosphate isomerase/epimerase
MLDGLGLGISAYSPDFRSVPPSTCESAAYLGVLKRYLWFCRECDIRLLRIDTVAPPVDKSAGEFKRDHERLVTTLKAAAEEAKQQGVTIVWEFEPGFWLNKPSEVLGLVKDVGSDHFKLLFDTSHAYMGSVRGARHIGEREVLGGGVADYARMLLSYIGHLHLIDSNGELHNGETSIHEAFGKGLIDFGSVMSVLAPVAANLDWWCVDFCFNPDTPSAAQQAVHYVKALREELCR